MSGSGSPSGSADRSRAASASEMPRSRASDRLTVAAPNGTVRAAASAPPTVTQSCVRLSPRSRTASQAGGAPAAAGSPASTPGAKSAESTAAGGATTRGSMPAPASVASSSASSALGPTPTQRSVAVPRTPSDSQSQAAWSSSHGICASTSKARVWAMRRGSVKGRVMTCDAMVAPGTVATQAVGVPALLGEQPGQRRRLPRPRRLPVGRGGQRHGGVAEHGEPAVAALQQDRLHRAGPQVEPKHGLRHCRYSSRQWSSRPRSAASARAWFGSKVTTASMFLTTVPALPCPRMRKT